MPERKHRNRTIPDEASAREGPSADDFKPEAVRRAVLSETIQHPATILPSAVGLVALLWSSVIQFSPASLGVFLGSVFLGASSWFWNYYVRGEERAEKHVRRLLASRMQHSTRDVEEVERRCREAGFEEGAKETKELAAAYQTLHGFLEEKMKEGENLSAKRFQVLAEDTFQEGVAILRNALAIFTALASIDVQTLEREHESWRRQLARSPEDADAERGALQRRIDAHTQRIDLYRERERALHGLLAEANELETALETAYLKCIDLVGTDVGLMFRQDGAATQIEAAVEAARRTEERLRKLTHEVEADDKEYYEAGKRRP